MWSMGDAHDVRSIGGQVTIEDLLVLYDGQVRDVHAFLLRRCGDVSLAEDLTQEVFVAAATRFRDAGEVPRPAWLYHTARSRLIDHWRRRARRDRKLRLVGASDRDDQRPDPADRVVSAERLDAALAELSEDHRAVLVLRYLDDLPVREVAESLGRSVRATESLLVRARRNLEAEYGRHDGE